MRATKRVDSSADYWMKTMRRAKTLAVSTAMAVVLAACGGNSQQAAVEPDAAKDNQAVAVAPKPAPSYDGTIGKPGAPFSLSYKVIGTPIVGSPVTVNLRVMSTLGSQPLRVNYRINDAAAMMFHEAQPLSIEMAPATDEDFVLQQVTVIPQREGRMYLNVGASVETEEGSMSSMMAIPIQVGTGGRILEENGEVQTDEDGEAIRVLTPD
jgi:hypothetical protein